MFRNHLFFQTSSCAFKNLWALKFFFNVGVLQFDDSVAVAGVVVVGVLVIAGVVVVGGGGSVVCSDIGRIN